MTDQGTGAARPSNRQELTGADDGQGSLDSLDELDRRLANRPLARIIARFVWDYAANRKRGEGPEAVVASDNET